MRTFKELHERLFKSRDIQDYLETLRQISDLINTTKDYNPKSLDLFERDFPDRSCSAYVCVNYYDTYTDERARSGMRSRQNIAGAILARHGHWDRDKYLGDLGITEHIAGGPLEKLEYQVCWFPIYTKEHLKIAIEFMVKIHKDVVLKDLYKEGFLT